jgi:hypothetical protein
MATYNKFNDYAEQIGLKLINLNTDTIRAILTNTAPVATNTILSNITQIANGNGYTTDGIDIVNVWSEDPAGTGKMVGTDPVWTSSGAGMAEFQYVVLYDSTSSAKHLIGWWDNESAVNVAVGSSFTVEFVATVLTIT